MAQIDVQMSEYDLTVKDLTVKLDEVTITDEKLNLNIQINQEKDFIISLYKIKNNNNYVIKKEDTSTNISNNNINGKKRKILKLNISLI